MVDRSGYILIMRPIVLLTDFGHRDHYVGVVHAVLSRLAPASDRIDLCHEISFADLWGAGFALAAAWPHLPHDSIVLAVVDPGVGSSRRGVAARYGERWIVAPDNGLAASPGAAEEVFELCARTMKLGEMSNTFHGRDLFAPAAAHLARGDEPRRLGPSIQGESLVKNPLPEAEVFGDQIIGAVIHIDHFGNLITNIDAQFLLPRSVVAWSPGKEARIVASYFEGGTHEIIALKGSSQLLELSINGGSAARNTGLELGSPVRLTSFGNGRDRNPE